MEKAKEAKYRTQDSLRKNPMKNSKPEIPSTVRAFWYSYIYKCPLISNKYRINDVSYIVEFGILKPAN